MTSTEKSLILLRYLHERSPQSVDSYDEELQERLGIGQRQLSREMETLALHFDRIVEIRKNRRKAYKLIEPLAVLDEAYRHDMKLGILFAMAQEQMPEILQEWHETSLRMHKPYLFFNMPYEDIGELEESTIFKSLKSAIENREYRSIKLKGAHPKIFRGVKPLKLLFSEGNWYVAYADGKDLRISRIAFIDTVEYAGTANYRLANVEPMLEWLETRYQNPFSRYGIESKTATLRAAPNIAHYFDEGMKRFFKSQRFVRKEDDGSIVFTIEYTQEMEILPFLQRWMPDLAIIEPYTLKVLYRNRVQEALATL